MIPVINSLGDRVLSKLAPTTSGDAACYPCWIVDMNYDATFCEWACGDTPDGISYYFYDDCTYPGWSTGPCSI